MLEILHEFTFFGLLDKPWGLHTYGLLIATGFLFAMQLAKRQASREREDPDRVVDMAFFVLLTGLIGSRIVFIITMYEQYLQNPVEILMFWRGGLVWYGGFIGAAAFVAWYCRKHNLNFLKYADMFIPFVAFAHAFGRLGCLCAGCCFGSPTDLPWGLEFPDHSVVHQVQLNERLVTFGEPALPVHPTQLYEAGFEMLMFWVLMYSRRFKRFHGQLFLIWLATYPIARSFIEVYRGDKVRGVWFAGLSTSQYISMAVALFAAWLFFHLRRQRLRTSEPVPA